MNRLSMLRTAFLVVVLAVLAVLPSVARATWVEDPSINLPVYVGMGTQEDAVSVPDGAGGVIVFWVHTGQDVIYAQRISAAGVPLWPSSGIVVADKYGYKEQREPRAISDGAGGAIVTWFDGDAAAVYDVHAQRISPSGARLWGNSGVPVSAAVDAQLLPVLVSDGAGGAIIAWPDRRTSLTVWGVYAQRVDGAGSVQWTTNGVALCDSTGTGYAPAIVSDGAGGAIVVWADKRNVVEDIFAQRILASGQPQWAANGVPICSATGIQKEPVAVADYQGGAYVGWMDLRNDGGDVFAQRVNASGVAQFALNGVAICATAGVQSSITVMQSSSGAAFAWVDERSGASNKDIYTQRIQGTGAVSLTSNGAPVCTAIGNQYRPQMTTDGNGGSIYAWWDERAGQYNQDIYAQRMDLFAAVKWTANGIAVSTAPSNQTFPSMIGAPSGSAIVAWTDYRNGSGDIYSQLIRSEGEIGNAPPPIIVDITDVPNDQGGKVQIDWTASSKDYVPAHIIESYTVWRRVPDAALASAALTSTLGGSTKTRIQTATAGGQSLYWEHVATIPARGFQGYSYVAETTSDSLDGSNPYTDFMILAEEIRGVPYYASAPDSGYSVDNLAPEGPGPIGGQYAGGAVHIHWSRNLETDLSGYRVYRGSHAAFEINSESLLGSTADTIYADPGAPGSYYKLTAVDLHGNESPASLLSPAQITGVEETEQAAAIRFGFPSPNPTRGSVAFRVVLPGDSDVRFSIYDVQGRAVRGEAARRFSAGQHVFQWDGRGPNGTHCAAGVYYARLEVNGKTAGTRRVTIVH